LQFLTFTKETAKSAVLWGSNQLATFSGLVEGCFYLKIRVVPIGMDEPKLFCPLLSCKLRLSQVCEQRG